MNIEDKKNMEKYILNNPFDFKQGIISHCREMDKIDVYNWVAEDELKINELQQENKILKENAENNDKTVDKVNWENMLLKNELKNKPDTEITLQDDKGNKFMLIQTERIDMQEELNKTIQKLFNNWNKLKEYLYNQIPTDKTVLTKYIKIFEVLDKMKELEGSDNNEIKNS